MFHNSWIFKVNLSFHCLFFSIYSLFQVNFGRRRFPGICIFRILQMHRSRATHSSISYEHRNLIKLIRKMETDVIEQVKSIPTDEIWWRLENRSTNRKHCPNVHTPDLVRIARPIVPQLEGTLFTVKSNTLTVTYWIESTYWIGRTPDLITRMMIIEKVNLNI